MLSSWYEDKISKFFVYSISITVSAMTIDLVQGSYHATDATMSTTSAAGRAYKTHFEYSKPEDLLCDASITTAPDAQYNRFVH